MEVPFGRPDLLTPQERSKVKPLYHPPVEPPHNLRRDIFDREKLQHVDDFVSKTPANILSGTLKQLVDHVCSNKGWKDVEKFWALFGWITSQPSRFTNVPKSEVSPSSPYALMVKCSRRTLSKDPILEAACHLARIPCYTVRGKSKHSIDYEQGEPMDWDRLQLWNIVHVAGSWRIVDSDFCSCRVEGRVTGKWILIERDGKETYEIQEASKGVRVYQFSDEHFMPDPELFKWIHFPVVDPKWQLSHTPVTQKDFENHFLVRLFFKFGMKKIPETVIPGVTESKKGKLVLPFGLTPPKGQGLRFSYKLYRKRERDQRRKNVDGILERYVFFEHRDDFFKFHIRFPIESRYKIELLAASPDDTDRTSLCCSYVINCPERMEECNPLPPCPAIGYGVVPATKEAGLTTDHTQAEVITKTGYLEIRLTREKALALYQMLKNSAIDEATLLQYTLTETVGDEVIIYLRLPKKGEYVINLYAQEPLRYGKAANVLNYLIQCQNTHTDVSPFPNITTGRLGRDEMMCNKLSVNAISHTQGTVKCGSGTVAFTFEKRSGYENSLFVELHSCDASALKAATQEVTQGDRDCQVKLDIPEDGEYGLNVFCQDKPGQLHNVHSYLITKKGNEAKVKKAQGAKESSIIPTKVLRTKESQMEIAIPEGCAEPMAELHRRNGNSIPGQHRLSQIKKGKNKLLTVDLAGMGDYMLTLFDVDKMRFLVRTVHRYLIEFAEIPGADVINLETLMDDVDEDDDTDDNAVVEPPTAEEKLAMYRRKMDECRKLDDVDQLKKLVQQFLKEGGEKDDGAVVKARHHLRIHEAKKALEAACTDRDINAIDKAIPRAKKVNRRGELSKQETAWSQPAHRGEANLSDLEDWLEDPVGHGAKSDARLSLSRGMVSPNQATTPSQHSETPPSSEKRHRAKFEGFHVTEGDIKDSEGDTWITGADGISRRKHRKRPASSSVFTCPHCPYKSNRHFNVQRHERLAHSKKKPEFSCKECGTSYSLEYRLKLHIKAVHQGEGHHCHICNKTFETMTGLKSHVVTKHKHEDPEKAPRPPPPELTCPLCGRVFFTKAHLQKHTATHVMVQPYRCFMCNRPFLEEASWLSHQSVCREPFTIQCSLCSKVLATPQELLVHMDTAHGRAEYSCNCGKSFPWKKSLLTHQQKCTIYMCDRPAVFLSAPQGPMEINATA